MSSGNQCDRRLRSDSPILAELSGGLDSSSIVCMADDIIANEREQIPRLDTISYYDKTEPSGDDWIYFQKIEEKRGRVGIHIDGSKLASSPASLQCSEFCPMPGALGVGQKLGDERADAVRSGGYRAVLSGIGGDEFMGGIPDPRAQLADLIVQFKLFSLARQLTAWSLVKRQPWLQLLWQSAIEVVPASLGSILGKGGQESNPGSERTLPSAPGWPSANWMSTSTSDSGYRRAAATSPVWC